MLEYENAARGAIAGWRTQLANIPPSQRALLPSDLHAKATRAEECVARNAQLLRAIVHENEATGAIGPAATAASEHYRRTGGHVDGLNSSKVRAIFAVPAVVLTS